MKSEKLFCLSLETGALVVSGIQLFFCSFSLIIGSISLSHKDDLINAISSQFEADGEIGFEDKRSLIKMCWFFTLTLNILIQVIYFSGIEILFAVLIVCAVVNIVSDLCVVYGTIKKRHYFLLPWLTIFGISISLLMLECFAFTAVELYLLFSGNFAEMTRFFPTLIMTFGFTALYSYIWVCMKSLYTKFKFLNNPPEWNECEKKNFE
ncbi:hypothetical protein ACFFRR_008946 [Megaselia abdita]